MSVFCDQTIVNFLGGKGGDGCIHFHREKFVDRGGPDGGDGGQGGSIILVADENINTLSDFNTLKIFRADDAKNGQKKNMYGKSAIDLVLKVPVGTLLIDDKTKQLICDLKTPGQKFIIAKGGKGGLGNASFKSSVHKVPKFAETGEQGEVKKVLMELQMVADVGIIGVPSAGKSTLISVISNSKPKIAAYPFTTLIPNLGVVKMEQLDKKNQSSFVVADIPGLIQGAHLGKGLGHDFLRHVSRTEVLVHLVDPTLANVADYKIINEELNKFDKRLSGKDQIAVISKADAVSEEELEKYKKDLEKENPKLKNKIFIISSVTGKGLKDLIFEMFKRVQIFRKTRSENLASNEAILKSGENKVFKPHLQKQKFEVTYRREKKEATSSKMRKIFDVKGDRIEQVVKMTDSENPEGLERIYFFINKMGIRNELRKQGAQAGDRVRIAGQTFPMR